MNIVQLFMSPVRDCFPAQVVIVALLILILLDWVFGVGNAMAHHEFSSGKMREGIGHKCSELGFVCVGVIADALLSAGLNLGIQGPILVTVTGYLCIMEIGSLLETFAKLNPELAGSPVFELFASVKMIDLDDSDR